MRMTPLGGGSWARGLIQCWLLGQAMCVSALAQMSPGRLPSLIDLERLETSGDDAHLQVGDQVALTLNQTWLEMNSIATSSPAEPSDLLADVNDRLDERIWAKRNWIAGAAARIVLGERVSKWHDWLVDATSVRRGFYLSGTMFYLRDAAAIDEVDYHEDLSLPVHRLDEAAVAMKLFAQDSAVLATQPVMLTAITDQRVLAGVDVVPEPSTASLITAPLLLALLRRQRGGVTL